MKVAKSTPTILSVMGGVVAVVYLICLPFVNSLITTPALCPAVLRYDTPLDCALSLLAIRLIFALTLSVVLFLIFKGYAKYTLIISFLAISFAWQLRHVAKWFFTPIGVLEGEWLFFVLFFFLAAGVFMMVYYYITKLKMWLWLKLLLALVLWVILPFIVLYFERVLYSIFYT